MSEKLEMMDMVESGQSSFAQVKLPTGYLDEAGELHAECELKEMTGVEEDILASKKMTVTQKMSKIISNCVTRIGKYTQNEPGWAEKIGSLVTTDRLFLIIRIRMLSLGSALSFKFQCAECGKTSPQSVGLEDFKITGLSDPLKRKWEGKLPRAGKSYELKVQVGADDEKIVALKEEDAFSQVFMIRMTKLDGKVPTLKDIKNLSAFDRQYLRKELQKNEGVIDNTVEIVCPHCEAESKHEMDIGTPDFFFPSEM